MFIVPSGRLLGNLGNDTSDSHARSARSRRFSVCLCDVVLSFHSYKADKSANYSQVSFGTDNFQNYPGTPLKRQIRYVWIRVSNVAENIYLEEGEIIFFVIKILSEWISFTKKFWRTRRIAEFEVVRWSDDLLSTELPFAKMSYSFLSARSCSHDFARYAGT